MDKTVITNQMIEAGMSQNGALSFKQINLLGQGRYSGWRRRAVGKYIVDEVYEEFISLKDAHLKKGNRFKKGKNSTLERAKAFIVDNFTNPDGVFECPHAHDCCYSDECENCDTEKDYWVIIKDK